MFVPERPSRGAAKQQSSLVDAVVSKFAATPLQRVHLLKAIDDASGEAFRAEIANNDDCIRVVFNSDLAGIEEGSDKFFDLLSAKCDRMALCRDAVRGVLSSKGTSSGFSEWEIALISGCAEISNTYDQYWMAWMRAVQHKDVLAAIDDPRDTTVRNRNGCAFLKSPYTVVRVNGLQGGFEFEVESYAVFFAEPLIPVLEAFTSLIATLTPLTESAEHKAVVAYMQQYCDALGETSLDRLESAWEKCDRQWMACKGPLQVVHDIEDGYSDPMRCKQGPDFSLRFLDETYACQNAVIRDIQGHVCKYYEGRDTPISRDGLTALSNTSAGIYYIPFKTGCSLVFSYSGQSIPNRLEVKRDCGVKIYFDAVETQARVEQVKARVEVIFEEGTLATYPPDAVEQLVWHVAAHEVGHAIYGIRTMKEYVSEDVVVLLEEPRAELTAMFTLRLLRQQDVITDGELALSLMQFVFDGLRYFAKFDSQPMQPYIIFHVHAYNVYHKHGLVQLTADGRLSVNPEKVSAVLDDFSSTFEDILDACDMQSAEGGAALNAILEQLQAPSPFVQDLLKKRFGFDVV